VGKRLRKAWNTVRTVASRIPTAIDEAVFSVAPVWGARRMVSRQQRRLFDRLTKRLADRAEGPRNEHWEGAGHDRTQGAKWLNSRLSPDSGLELDLTTLQDRCDELYRSNPIAHAAVEGRVANEVGTGILPQAKIDDQDVPDVADDLNRAIQDIVRRWSENGIDRTGQHSLVQVEKLACRIFATFGEVFIVLGDRPANQPIPLVVDLIHPLRCETPPEFANDERVRLGIRTDTDGRVLGYYFRRSHPYDTVETEQEYDYVPAVDANGHPRCLHVFDPMFPGQSRGLPWMAAAINRLKDAGDVVEFTILAMQIEACFAAFVKSDAGGSPHDLATGTATGTDAGGRRLEELRPGAVEYLSKGETIDFATPVRPGSTFLPMIEFCLRSISACLDYPYELLANNFSRVTFSSGRLSMISGRLGFNMRRQVLVEKFLNPLWRRIVWEAVIIGELADYVSATDYARRPHVYERHVWQAKTGVVHINPEQEYKAHKLAIDEGFETLAEIWAEGGKDWEEGLAQRFKELAAKVKQHAQLEALQAELREELGLAPMPAGVVAGMADVKVATTTAVPTDSESADDPAQPEPDDDDQETA
jgi:lambda family phage portal protein